MVASLNSFDLKVLRQFSGESQKYLIRGAAFNRVCVYLTRRGYIKQGKSGDCIITEKGLKVLKEEV